VCSLRTNVEERSYSLPYEPRALAETLRKAARLQPGERLFGVVDGAQDLELAYDAKCHYGQEIISLFVGQMAAGAADVAPYLVPIDPASDYLVAWARHWGKNAGILLTTAAEPDRLHAHLREIFVVQDEQDQQFFFRYYDPRVLHAYLPTCRREELRTFWGPIHSIIAEENNGNGLLCFSLGSTGLLNRQVHRMDSIKEFPLSPTQQP
jgi:hypothetical protein